MGAFFSCKPENLAKSMACRLTWVSRKQSWGFINFFKYPKSEQSMNDKTIYRVCLSVAIIFAVILLHFLTPADESQSVVKYESGFYYTAEKRDTLWKISDRFFGVSIALA